MPTYKLLQGDCLDVLRTLPENSVDAIVTDPPYGLEFMGKDWDAPWKHTISETGYTDGAERLARPSFTSSRNPICLSCGKRQRSWKGGPEACKCAAPKWDRKQADEMRGFQDWCEAWAAECLRVLKPGGHLLSFGGTRTYHRLACAIEDAGFEVRDSIHWVYGSGFPKSLNVGKAIDKAAGAVRTEVIGQGKAGAAFHYGNPGEGGFGQTADKIGGVPSSSWDITAPATDAAKTWDGWGTALKPSHEPIIVARKPLIGTVAENVQQHGTGALNIDGCRVVTTDNLNGGAYAKVGADRHDGVENWRYKHGGAGEFKQPEGRWPPNILLTHSAACDAYQCIDPACPDAGAYHDHPDRPNVCAEDCPVTEMDRQSGTLKSQGRRVATPKLGFGMKAQPEVDTGYGDSGGASRFFPVFKYQAKASRKEREAGLDALPTVSTGMSGGAQSHGEGYDQGQGIGLNRVVKVKNHHPTVKPIALMEWLITLVTPPNGTVLDPFTGSGTTGIAAINLDFNFIGIEREQSYIEIAKARIDAVMPPPPPAPVEENSPQNPSEQLDLLTFIQGKSDKR